MKNFMRQPYISPLGVPGYVLATVFTAHASTPFWQGLIACMAAGFVNYLVTDDES